MARPTKLTDAVERRFCDAIRNGLTIAAACAYAGIAERTFYHWRERGELRNGRHRRFMERVADAENEAARRMEAIVLEAAERDWRAAMKWLERRRPRDWGSRHAVTGGDGGPVVIRQYIGIGERDV